MTPEHAEKYIGKIGEFWDVDVGDADLGVLTHVDVENGTAWFYERAVRYRNFRPITISDSRISISKEYKGDFDGPANITYFSLLSKALEVVMQVSDDNLDGALETLAVLEAKINDFSLQSPVDVYGTPYRAAMQFQSNLMAGFFDPYDNGLNELARIISDEIAYRASGQYIQDREIERRIDSIADQLDETIGKENV